MAQGTSSSSQPGFHGSIDSLPLVDLLQLWALNRFSGLVTVSSHGREGKLHFVDGAIVDAEAAGLAGEPAVAAVLGWPDGALESFPNTTTLHRTIHKPLQHLLLDLLRALDEQRRSETRPANVRPPAELPPIPARRPPERSNVFEQLRVLPGVTQLVRFDADGRPVPGQGAGAEALAAKGLYLAANHAAAIQAAFGLRELAIAALQGERESLVVVHAGGHYLALALSPGTPAEPIVAQVRALLARPAGRQP